MTRLIDFYATQLRLLWEWRGGRLALLRRLAITVTVATISFAVTAWLLPGLIVESLTAAALAVTLISIFNAAVRPVILAALVPVSLILTAVAVLVLQFAAFMVVAQLAPGVSVSGVVSAIVASFVFAIVNTTLTAMLGVDRGGSYFSYLVQALRAKRAVARSDRPGVVILQIDGLAYPILAGRVRAGSVNTMASWIRSGTHRLSRWEALLPSMTSAGQLGILHGTNDGIPAFRWFERDRQKLMVSSNPADAAEIVRRASNGEGLLSNDGVSICNLVTGDAVRSYVTTAALADGSRGLGDSRAFFPFFFSPTGYLRSFTRFLGEFALERIQNRRMRRAGVEPRLDRSMKYAGMRAASNVLLRDVNVSLIIEEMYRGANVIYADFTDYDEIAHHSGPERVEAFQALDGIDAAFATIAKAAEDAPRPYEFVVLSDHGQSLGATFKQRYGESLGDLVRRLMGGGAAVAEEETHGEGAASTNAFLSEVVRAGGATGSVARLALGSKRTDGIVDIAPEPEAAPTGQDDAIVVGSGNLGLVYFTGFDHRLTVEELEVLHPGLIGALANHPGVSALLVRSATRGSLVLGHRGRRHLADGVVEGDDPLAPFGPHAILSLRREDAMEHVPDLLLISQYDPELGEVAAFEELIGSHGGLGGQQTEAFILHPTEWELDEPVPVGAPSVYRNLRHWLEAIGIPLGRPTAPTPATRHDETVAGGVGPARVPAHRA
ncbi:MAG TPA: phage holin family protein [Candidatus Limnocylindrales bacterium]|nr:phage holin family protein [Candidatus Limnocylindrales bacterium]